MRPTARDDEQGVDADVVAGPLVTHRQALGGDGDAAQPVLIEREARRGRVAARLDLDEGHDPPAPRDDVDLAAEDPRATGEDAPAVEAEPPSGDGLRPPAGALSGGAVAAQEPARSSARA